MAKKIYALLVGIIDYNQEIMLDNNRVYFPKLNGCVIMLQIPFCLSRRPIC